MSPNNVTAIRTDGFWNPFQSVITELCTICSFNKQPVLYLKGFCKNSHINWVFYPSNNGSWQVAYEGYRYTRINMRNGSWVMTNRIPSGVVYDLPSFKGSFNEYPIGRHEWTFDDNRECKDSSEAQNVTLSACQLEDEFTCGNGLCIPIEMRCDNHNDCEDNSDEYSCLSIQLPTSYDKYKPPLIENKFGKKALLEIRKIHIDVLSINQVMLEVHKIDVSFRLTFEWIDNRITYFNNENDEATSLVALPLNSLKNIWNPERILCHKHADIGSVFEDQLSKEFYVNITNHANIIDPEQSFENIFYAGKHGQLSLSYSSTGVYHCSYDIFRFPFGMQRCTIRLSLKANSEIKILEETVSISCNNKFLEYEMTNWTFYSNKSFLPILEFGFSIELKQLYFKHLTQLYFQVLLIWAVSFLTLFIPIEDFSNRFIGIYQKD